MKTIRFALILTLALLPAGLALAGDTVEPASSPDSAGSANTPTPNDSQKSLVASQTATNLLAGQSGWIGIRVAPVSEALGKQLSLPDTTGLTVVNLINDGPADKAGIKRYDVIAAVNGKPAPAKPGTFVEQIVREKPGRQLRIEVIRAGKRLKRTVTVAAPRTLGEVGYKYDANGKPVQDVESVQAKVYRKVNNNWVPERDPNRIKAVLGRNNEAFSQLANADQPTNEAPAETVGWTDVQGNRYIVSRNGKELTVVKGSPESQDRTEDGKLKAWNYDSPAEFRQADPNTHAQFARLTRQQRAVSQASRHRMDQYQLSQADPRVDGVSRGGKAQRAAASPATKRPRRDGKEKDRQLAECLPDEMEGEDAEESDGAEALAAGGGETAEDHTGGKKESTGENARVQVARDAPQTGESARSADGPTVPATRKQDREPRGPDQTKADKPKYEGKGAADGGESGKRPVTPAERRKLISEIEKILADMDDTLTLLRSMHRPAEEFRVAKDGEITVIRRKGDSAIQMKFKNTKDLVDRAPGAYKRYRELRRAIEAK